MIIYGIKNCDTVKKALTWLNEKGVGFEFHDYKKEGVAEEKLKNWCQQVGWEILLNKKGTTWRKLNEAEQVSVTNEATAIKIMMNNTSIIKRPVLEKAGKVLAVGFDEAVWGEKVN